MSWKYWIKIQGSSESTFGAMTTLSIELPIFGLHPTYEVESSSEVSMSGTEIGQRRIRVGIEVDCIPNSTWDAGTVTTDNIQYLLQVILQQKYTRLIAPTAPKSLPERWSNSTNFPYTTGLISSGFVFSRCEIANEKAWGSGNEKFTLTVRRKELI